MPMPVFVPKNSAQKATLSRLSALKVTASTVVITALLGATPALAQASGVGGYATGGEGQYRGQIMWFSWGNAGAVSNTGIPNRTNRVMVAGRELAVTCSLTNISGTGTGANHFNVYKPGSWKGDGLDDLYNIGGTGGGNTMTIGLSNAENGQRAEGDFDCSATYGGAPYQLEGLIFADAEATATDFKNPQVPIYEQIGVILPQATKFRFIERYSKDCTSSNIQYQVEATAYTNDPTKTQYAYTAPAGNCEASGTGPMGIGFIEGETSARFFVKGNGVQSIALGVMTYIADLGDAPASYGAAAHVPQFTWTGGEVQLGTKLDVLSPSFQMATSIQPSIRLGATVDVEPFDVYSPNARGDDNSGTSDEDALPGDVTTPLIAVGDTYTLENVLCTATPGSAPVYGYIDFNRDGDFEDAGERSNLATCSGVDSSVDLTWTAPASLVGGNSFLRIRTASNAAQIASPTGVATQGEVEDYQIYLTVAQIQLNKTLTGRVNPDDQMTIEIVQDNVVLETKTTTGTGGGTNATAATDIAAALPTSNVILRESISAGGDLAAYDRSISCVAGTNNRAPVGQPTFNAVDGTWALPIVQGNDVVCTITNTGKPHIAVTKTTEGGFGGAFNFTATNLSGTIAAITTTANATAAPLAPVFTTPQSNTTAVVLSEDAFTGYALAGGSCTDAHATHTGNASEVATLQNGQFTLDPTVLRAGARITCNFVNRKDAVLKLEKTLPSGRYNATDQFGLVISTNATEMSRVTTSGAGSTVTGQAIVNAPVLGQVYALSETAAGTPVADLARYQSVWSCSNDSQVTGAQVPSGTGNQFSVTPAAGDDLTCVISNTRKNKADLSIAKTNTIAQGINDLSNDMVLPNTDTTYVLTITNNGPDSVTGAQVYDPAPAAPLTCPATAIVTCTSGACPSTPITLGQLQTSPGLTIGTLANAEVMTLSYTCRVQ